MLTIEIKSEVAIEIIRKEINSMLPHEYQDRMLKSFMLGVRSFIVKYEEDANTFGFESGSNYVCINYHQFMGEILIALRNAGVDGEVEWVSLSNLDREFQKFLETNPYL